MTQGKILAGIFRLNINSGLLGFFFAGERVVTGLLSPIVRGFKKTCLESRDSDR